LQIPAQPPQALVDEAKKNVRRHLLRNPNYRVTSHGLVDDGIVERYEAPDGHLHDVSIAAIDDLVARGVLEQISLDAHVLRSRFLRQPPDF
jgi:hypothetical protein